MRIKKALLTVVAKWNENVEIDIMAIYEEKCFFV